MGKSLSEVRNLRIFFGKNMETNLKIFLKKNEKLVHLWNLSTKIFIDTYSSDDLEELYLNPSWSGPPPAVLPHLATVLTLSIKASVLDSSERISVSCSGEITSFTRQTPFLCLGSISMQGFLYLEIVEMVWVEILGRNWSKDRKSVV